MTKQTILPPPVEISVDLPSSLYESLLTQGLDPAKVVRLVGRELAFKTGYRPQSVPLPQAA